METSYQKNRQKYEKENIYSIDNTNNIDCCLTKSQILVLLLLIVNVPIFVFFCFFPQLNENYLKKIDKRGLGDFGPTDLSDTDYAIKPVVTTIPVETTIPVVTTIPSKISTTSQIIADTTSKPDTYDHTDFKCTAVEFFNDECDPYAKNNTAKTNYINHIIDQIEEGLFEGIFDDVIENEKNIIQNDSNITYIISTVTSQYLLTNHSKVSLENCESTLKRIYSLEEDDKLILLKLEHDVGGIQIPIIEYQLFTRDGERLNLSYCDQITESISIPVNISEKDRFIHDPNSDFYQDRCYVYTTEYDTDLTIYDRKNNFNEKFLSLCEVNCEYKGYNDTTSSVNCECKTKTEFPKLTVDERFDLAELVFQFVNFDKITNIFVFTCYKQLFCSKGFKTNSGSYINMALITGSVIFAVFFYLKGFNSFQNKIKDFMDEKFPNNEENSQQYINTNINVVKQDSEVNANDQNMKPKVYNDYEYSKFDYEEARKEDNRTFFQSYLSQIRQNHIIIFTFFLRNDYNSTLIKICFFLFWLSLNMAMNGLFFNDETMHKIYIDKGKYNFLYQLPIIIYPILISNFLTKLLKHFASVQGKITDKAKYPKNKEELMKDIDEIIYKVKRRFPIFLSIMLILFLLFWYYLSEFCAVYKNTQIPLIKDTFIGYAFSLLAPFVFYFILTYFRYLSLKTSLTSRGSCFFGFCKVLDNIFEFIL